jgi:RimJ/RimL family protein N-acetyltransferase
MNEIGIFLKKEFHGLGFGNKALRLLMKQNPKKRYLANISPHNKKSIEFFKKNGFSLIQYTYELRK